MIAGRACDTAIFAAVPVLLGCAMGPAMHMAKIIECASLCCVPGGRDPILATLEGESFVLESMHPERRATAMSVHLGGTKHSIGTVFILEQWLTLQYPRQRVLPADTGGPAILAKGGSLPP